MPAVSPSLIVNEIIEAIQQSGVQGFPDTFYFIDAFYPILVDCCYELLECREREATMNHETVEDYD